MLVAYGQTSATVGGDLQNIFTQLLQQGMSYAQVMLKYNMCKQLYGKGTPMFYTCMGVPPPPQTQQPQTPPSPPPPPPQQPPPPPPPQQANTSSGLNPMVLAALGIGVVALVFLLRDKKEEVK